VSESAVLGNKVAVFTHRPSTVKKIITVDYPRPRLAEDAGLTKFQQEILAELKPEVKAKGEE
jgi:NitT/TauT family transport system ATP-binding protein